MNHTEQLGPRNTVRWIPIVSEIDHVGTLKNLNKGGLRLFIIKFYRNPWPENTRISYKVIITHSRSFLYILSIVQALDNDYNSYIHYVQCIGMPKCWRKNGQKSKKKVYPEYKTQKALSITIDNLWLVIVRFFGFNRSTLLRTGWRMMIVPAFSVMIRKTVGHSRRPTRLDSCFCRNEKHPKSSIEYRWFLCAPFGCAQGALWGFGAKKLDFCGQI